MSKQLSHKEHQNPNLHSPIIILADNLMGDANIGSLFRLADAFNVEKVIFTRIPINLQSNRMKRTARGTFQYVEHEFHEDPLDVLKNLKLQGYKSFALEITSDSVALDNIEFKKFEKLLLVVGNERFGVSDRLLENIDTKIHIRMFGNNSSMNVAQATGIALYEITKTLPLFQQK